VRTLLRLFARSGGIRKDRWSDLGMIGGAALARWPFDLLEKWVVRRAEKQGRSPSSPPLFILGHWRSGTTHLYNILSKSSSFGCLLPIGTGLPWNMLTLGRWLEPWLVKALPSERFIDNVAVHRDAPQEDEIALANMTDISFYHGLYFPKHFHSYFRQGIFLEGEDEEVEMRWKETFQYFMKKLELVHGGKSILVKNPVYTARVALLRELYPDAKFIHIHRNPYRVYASMQHFYNKLLHELSFQAHDHLSIETIILEHYSHIMDRLIRDSSTLPEGHFIELGYDALVENPMHSLETIYRTLHMDHFNEDKGAFETYLKSVKRYKKNPFHCDSVTKEKIERYWAPYIHRWNYRPPDAGEGNPS
jgi:hypothetical protein